MAKECKHSVIQDNTHFRNNYHGNGDRKTIYCLDCDEGQGTTANNKWWKKARRNFIKNHWGHRRVEGEPLLSAKEIVAKHLSSNEKEESEKQ